MTNTNLTDADIATLRSTLGLENADISRTCSDALWGDTHQKRSGARRKLNRLR